MAEVTTRTRMPVSLRSLWLGLCTAHRMRRARKGVFTLLLLLIVTTIITTIATPAAMAQGVGFQGGGTVTPDQFYVGSHFEFLLGSDSFLLRPSVEGGSGDGLTAASVNFEFLYRYWLPGDRWAIYQGTGPAVNFYRFDDDTSVRGGLNFVFGARHESGFFTELKIGGSGSPNLRYGVGFTIPTGRTP